jgi:hypothetical protein
MCTRQVHTAIVSIAALWGRGEADRPGGLWELAGKYTNAAPLPPRGGDSDPKMHARRGEFWGNLTVEEHKYWLQIYTAEQTALEQQ